MKLYSCQHCNQLLYFENTSCERCGHAVGYIPHLDVMSAVEENGPAWRAIADPTRLYRFCKNWEQKACNWLVEADEPSTFCKSCEHNRTIPDLTDPKRHAAWVRLETAKRRLIYSLLRFNLPMPSAASGETDPLAFDFLASQPGQPVFTGHDSGTITILIEEADDAERERLRTALNEPYRTLLGHFRHEVGHYYWNRLVRDGGRLKDFRTLFGDERADYEAAKQAYYANPPGAGWQENYVSAYASMHPWEDFAETWAHFLHMVDALETAAAFGISISPEIPAGRSIAARIEIDPYKAESAAELLNFWLPAAFAVNSINRSLGQPDAYPFVVNLTVLEKLEFIRGLVVQAPH